MNKSKKKTKIIVLAIIGAILLALVFVIKMSLPKKLTVENIDIISVANGKYNGIAENGLVNVEVEVEVKNGAVLAIDIKRHDNGLGSKAEEIIPQIIHRQSLDVEAVAGATFSSNTILKAVENALKKGE